MRDHVWSIVAVAVAAAGTATVVLTGYEPDLQAQQLQQEQLACAQLTNELARAWDLQLVDDVVRFAQPPAQLAVVADDLDELAAAGQGCDPSQVRQQRQFAVGALAQLARAGSDPARPAQRPISVSATAWDDLAAVADGMPMPDRPFDQFEHDRALIDAFISEQSAWLRTTQGEQGYEGLVKFNLQYDHPDTQQACIDKWGSLDTYEQWLIDDGSDVRTYESAIIWHPETLKETPDWTLTVGPEDRQWNPSGRVYEFEITRSEKYTYFAFSDLERTDRYKVHAAIIDDVVHHFSFMGHDCYDPHDV